MMLYDDPHAQEYYLWRLMIDRRYQGKAMPGTRYGS